VTKGLNNDAVVAWCRDTAVAEQVAVLFARHAEPSYISHSELQTGRAVTPDAWANDLQARVYRLAVRAVATPPDTPEGIRLATLMGMGRLEGFAFVSFASGPDVPYATLEDLLVVPRGRSRGRGERLLAWIAEECAARGMRRLFLESGILNHRAHEFFERQGFRQTSIVMVRDL
jgi:GNAT superfamily N-acetyltransferase